MNSHKFNTDYLQTYPDFFYKEPDDILIKKNNNSRYKFFKQNHFTAGDQDQFLEFWDCSVSKENIVIPNLNKEIPTHINIKWKKYKNLCIDNILNTYNYISDKFKKGIFLKIVDGEGKVFLPFSKVDYQNEWSEKIKVNPKKFSNIIDLMKYTANVENREFFESRVHKNVKAWYGNNGLVRLEFPISEGDSGVNMIKDMFNTLIKERKLPPSNEIFINKRDFPLLKLDDTESYNSFFGNRTKLLSHLYDKYAPILSMTTSNLHADIPIPTWEDWSRIAYWTDGKMFGKEFKKYPKPEEFDEILWNDKIPTAIFRGASTGLGTKLENNIRLQLSAESIKNLKDDDDIPFINVGITKWNLRPRKHPNYPYIETIHVEEMPFDIVKSMSPLEQAHYKYILHLPGHSEAYRLSLELYSGSVILYYPCEYELWFFKWLKPWVHYIPLTGTIDDIYEKIKWCKQNDEKCKEMVKNARNFAEKYLTRDAILDYLQNTLWNLFNITGKIEHSYKNMNNLNLELYVKIKKNQYNFLEQFKLNNEIEKISEMNVEKSFELTQIIFQKLGSKFYNNLELVKKGKNTELYKFNYQDKFYAIKKTRHSWKSEDKFQLVCNYLYINELHKICPNFIYTYNDFTESNISNIVTDFVEGKSMEEFISSKEFKFSQLIDIYLYLSLILNMAQQYCGFIHMDLFPWNIIISKSNKPISYKFNDNVIELNNNFIPILIDYGKSHFVYDNIHHYNTNPFYLCKLQDIISIVFSSLFIILNKHQLNDKEIKYIIQIMNFFSGSEYANKTNFTNIGQVKYFLKKHKKFSNMLGEKKSGLENKSPLDFFNFLINKKIPHNITINYNSSILINNPIWQSTSIETNYLKLKFIENEIFSILNNSYDIFEFRKHYLLMENIWNYLPNNHEEKYLFIWNAKKLFQNIKNIFNKYESENNIKIWDNNKIEFFIDSHPKLFDINYNLKLPDNLIIKQLPNYSTHICKSCLKKDKYQPFKAYNLDKFIYLNIIIMILNVNSIDFFDAYLKICNQNTFCKLLE